MSSTTLLTQDQPSIQTLGVGDALRQLRAAIGQLLASIGAAIRRRSPLPDAPTSRAQAAANVREMAFRLRQSDPGFAADLFAAADHPERASHDEPTRADSVAGVKR